MDDKGKENSRPGIESRQTYRQPIQILARLLDGVHRGVVLERALESGFKKSPRGFGFVLGSTRMRNRRAIGPRRLSMLLRQCKASLRHKARSPGSDGLESDWGCLVGPKNFS